MSSSRSEKSLSGSSHGPASSTVTFRPRSASSFATTGPPPPHPMTRTSGSISEVHAVLGDTANRAVEADLVPHARALDGARLRIEPCPLREEPADREHLQR